MLVSDWIDAPPSGWSDVCDRMPSSWRKLLRGPATATRPSHVQLAVLSDRGLVGKDDPAAVRRTHRTAECTAANGRRSIGAVLGRHRKVRVAQREFMALIERH